MEADLDLPQHSSHWENGGEVARHWQAEQLERLGVPLVLAAIFADTVDWHEVEELVTRGCSPDLALEIVR